MTRLVLLLALTLMASVAARAGVVPLETQPVAPLVKPNPLSFGGLAIRPSIQECEQRRAAGKVRRLALVVGNNQTKNYRLENAISDALLMQNTFVELGYEVASAYDADRQSLLMTLDQFKEHIKTLCEHDVALFYYAGNGFEISGITYIATPDVEYPVDPEGEHAVLAQWLRLTDVLARLAHHSGPKIVLIDTCRHDPLAKKRTARTPPPGGLKLPPNTLVSYASEPGHEANDIGPNGKNGPYAYFVSEALKRKDDPPDALKLFSEVRTSVGRSTAGTRLEQWPFVDQTLQGYVYLGPLQSRRAGSKRHRNEKAKTASLRRVALVVGNGDYQDPSLPPLPNAINDAKALTGALRRAGFEVRERYDLDKSQTEQELLDFELNANGADIALIYYAGHGIERNSSPFIVPVRAMLAKDTDIDSEGIAVMPLLEHLRGVRKLGVLILDACRNNPLEAIDNVVGDARNHRVSSGLPGFEVNVENIVVAYSAQHGTASYDGEGRNGYFVEALVSNLETPNTEVGMLFRKVRDAVLRRSSAHPARQQPWTYSTLPGEPIFLVPGPVRRLKRQTLRTDPTDAQ